MAKARFIPEGTPCDECGHVFRKGDLVYSFEDDQCLCASCAGFEDDRFDRDELGEDPEED